MQFDQYYKTNGFILITKSYVSWPLKINKQDKTQQSCHLINRKNDNLLKKKSLVKET